MRRSCRFCGCVNSTSVVFFEKHYIECDGCGARGPVATNCEDAEAGWNGDNIMGRVIRPKNYFDIRNTDKEKD